MEDENGYVNSLEDSKQVPSALPYRSMEASVESVGSNGSVEEEVLDRASMYMLSYSGQYEPSVAVNADNYVEEDFSFSKHASIDDTKSDSNVSLTPAVNASMSTPKALFATDWNAEFQRVSELDGPERWEQIGALAHDFENNVKHYAAMIISEIALPMEAKTIRPSTKVGGTAGGTKFVAGGILFKFAQDTNMGSALDPFYLYGGREPDLEAAAKALGQELKGMAGFFWADVKGLNFPLMCLVDYFGFRVLAVSLLPVGKDTLLYGSDSGGKLANSRDKKLNSLMEQVGKYLNLAPHFVGRNKALIYGPGDIEGHKGTDGRLYVLDFGRVYPPEAPEPGSVSGSIFYKLLRPELVRTSRNPLCSDAFSGFCKMDSRHQQFADEVRHVTNMLYFKVIPEFAESLGETGYELEFIYPDFMPIGEFLKRVDLGVELHRAGINIRHLGRVRFISTSSVVRCVLLSECAYRVLKNYLRSEMRLLLKKLSLPRASPFQSLLVEVYNKVLSNDDQFWETQVADLLKKKFGERVLQGRDVSAARHAKEKKAKSSSNPTVSSDLGISPQKSTLANNSNNNNNNSAPLPTVAPLVVVSEKVLKVREQVDPSYIVTKLNTYFGGIAPHHLRGILQDKLHVEVLLNDFTSFAPSIKHLGLAHYATGRALALRGMADRLECLSDIDAARRLRFLREAREHLQRVLLTSPDSTVTLILLARIDLFSVMYFAERGDLHLVDAALKRAILRLELAQKYVKGGWEVSSLLVIAFIRWLQFLPANRRDIYEQRLSDNLREALRASPTCLDSFLYDVLRETNAVGRQLLLSEVHSLAGPLASDYMCDKCKKRIIFREMKGYRYHCRQCTNFDLCEKCFPGRDKFHDASHQWEQFGFADHRDQVSTSVGDKIRLHEVLLERLRAASRGITELVICDTHLKEDDISLLDCSHLERLDVSGCRMIRRIPENITTLRSLNVSNCHRLDDTSGSVLGRNPLLAELRARGMVGKFRESGDDISALHGLTLLDLQRRTLVERFSLYSDSLERIIMTNASHVGGVCVGPRLRSCFFEGSELIKRVVLSPDLVQQDEFQQLRASISGTLELEDNMQKLEEDLKKSSAEDMRVAMSLGNFLRQQNATLALKNPSKHCYLKVFAPAVEELTLKDSLSVEEVSLSSPSLLVLNLFRINKFVVNTWNLPRLTTLYLSEWEAAADVIESLIDCLSPTLKNLFMCEMPLLSEKHVQAIVARCRRLVYLNLFGSSLTTLSLKQTMFLKEIACEGSAVLAALNFVDCPQLQRVIATKCPLLNPEKVVFSGCPTLKMFYSPDVPEQIWPFSKNVELGIDDYSVPAVKAVRKL